MTKFLAPFAAALILSFASAAKAEAVAPEGYVKVVTGTTINEKGEMVQGYIMIPKSMLGIQRSGSSSSSFPAGKPPINKNAPVGRRDHY